MFTYIFYKVCDQEIAEDLTAEVFTRMLANLSRYTPRGKPILAWVPFVVVSFEFAILFGVLFTLTGMLIQTRMPRLKIPGPYDPRFTEDRFGVLIPCSETEREGVIHLLKEAGAEEVRQVE